MPTLPAPLPALSRDTVQLGRGQIVGQAFGAWRKKLFYFLGWGKIEVCRCGLPTSTLPGISPTGGEIEWLKPLAHPEGCR